MPTIRIPAPLRAQTAGHAEVRVRGATARAALAELSQLHPGVGERLFAADGRLQRFVNVFVGDEDVRDLQGLDTPVSEDDVLSVVPAVAGGAGWWRPVAAHDRAGREVSPRQLRVTDR